MTCPAHDILIQFANATLSDHGAADLVAHLAACEICSQRVAELEHQPRHPVLEFLRDLQQEPPVGGDLPLSPKIGQYDILEKIGHGGMGVVYRAVHPHLKREVALKVIHDSRLDDPGSRERFLQEMQALGRLAHPNIVQATDAGVDGEILFIIMELLDGVDLSSYVEEHGPMPVKQAVDCLWQAATGLAFAHAAGYIHRDIKPSNLFLTHDGMLKILDLGLARPAKETDADGPTRTGHVVGSPEFMAPEQYRGGTVDARSDIYSLGQTFAHLLAESREAVPHKLQAILARMTAGLPDQRFQSVGDLLKALNALTANGSYRKSMAILAAVACFVLIIAALVGLYNSFGNAGIMAELHHVSETQIIESVRAEIERNAQREREKRGQAQAVDIENLREELDRYKSDKQEYDQEMKKYADQMKEWEKNKTEPKPSRPAPLIPPVKMPLQYPPEMMKEYEDLMKEHSAAMKEWENLIHSMNDPKDGESENKPVPL